MSSIVLRIRKSLLEIGESCDNENIKIDSVQNGSYVTKRQEIIMSEDVFISYKSDEEELSILDELVDIAKKELKEMKKKDLKEMKRKE